MRRAANIHWSQLAPLTKWVVLGLVLAIAGAVGCVNLALSPTPPVRQAAANARPRYPAKGSANVPKRPPVPTPRKTQEIAKNSSRMPARTSVNGYASRARPAATAKPSENLATAFDARRRPTIVQAGARVDKRSPSAGRSQIIQTGGKGAQVADPFLGLSADADDPVVVPDAPPEAVPQEPRPRYFPADTDDSSSDAPPLAQLRRNPRRELPEIVPSPEPERQERVRETRPREDVPGFVRPPEELDEPDPSQSTGNSQKVSADVPGPVPRTASRAHFLNRQTRVSPHATQRHKMAPDAIHDTPPEPSAFASRNDSPAKKPLRNNVGKGRGAQPQVESRTPENGQDSQAFDPELAQLPRLGDNLLDVPPVEMLPPPPAHSAQDLADSDAPEYGSSSEGTRYRNASRSHRREPEMAESYAQASEGHALAPPSAFRTANLSGPGRQRRTVAAKTAGREIAGSQRSPGNRDGAAAIPSHARSNFPIIRSRNHTDLNAVPAPPTPPAEKPALSRTNPSPENRRVAETPLGGATEGSPSELPSLDQDPSTPSGPQPVRLTGIIMEDDEEPSRPALPDQRQTLIPPDLRDSIPTHVPPPPLSAVPPPLSELTIPSQPTNGASAAATPGRIASSQVPIAPTVPVNSTAAWDPPLKDGFDADMAETTGPSLIGRTSLIGLGVGITGLMGLLIWRYLDRRSHRRRRINLAILKPAGIPAATGETETTPKIAQQTVEAAPPTIKRAA